jgi:hypothetical protein
VDEKQLRKSAMTIGSRADIRNLVQMPLVLFTSPSTPIRHRSSGQALEVSIVCHDISVGETALQGYKVWPRIAPLSFAISRTSTLAEEIKVTVDTGIKASIDPYPGFKTPTNDEIFTGRLVR